MNLEKTIMNNLANIEFYNFEDEVWFRGNGIAAKYTADQKEVTKHIINGMTEWYPLALKALQKNYSNSAANQNYYLYRIAHRFCRCNFGEIDNRSDLDHTGMFQLERVHCPLRGECKLEGIVCNPKFNSKISDSEMRVIELLYVGKDVPEIADKLCLSEHTVRNHTRNAITRLGLHSKAELLVYVSENNLITNDYE